MGFIISLFLCFIYFFIETNASSNRHYFQLYILFFTLRHGDDLLPLFYQPLISEALDAMTPAPLSASWLKSNLLRPQEIAGSDRKSPCLQKKHTVLLFLIHSRKTSTTRNQTNRQKYLTYPSYDTISLSGFYFSWKEDYSHMHPHLLMSHRTIKGCPGSVAEVGSSSLSWISFSLEAAVFSLHFTPIISPVTNLPPYYYIYQLSTSPAVPLIFFRFKTITAIAQKMGISMILHILTYPICPAATPATMGPNKKPKSVPR